MKGSTRPPNDLRAPHRMPSGTPISDDSTKPQKITWMLCQRLCGSVGTSRWIGRRGQRRPQGGRDLVGRRQVDRIGRDAPGGAVLGRLGRRDRVREGLPVHPHPGFEIVDVAGIGDQRPADARRPARRRRGTRPAAAARRTGAPGSGPDARRRDPPRAGRPAPGARAPPRWCRARSPGPIGPR